MARHPLHAKPSDPVTRAGKAVFNAAISYNVNNAVKGKHPDLKLDFPKILVSRGSLLPAENTAAVASGGNLNFTWNDNSGIGK